MTTQADAHRIEITHSDAHVIVRRDGIVLADTTRAVLLREGKLPTRYYIHPDDVRMDIMQPTDTSTHCPFKGNASYWSADIGGTVLEDIAWTYTEPIPEAEKIAGLVSFFNEKVDVEVDGEVLERPVTPWS
jgi:uncharacterized protein (DUF427 family)